MKIYDSIKEVKMNDLVVVREEVNNSDIAIGQVIGIYDRSSDYFKNDVAVQFKRGCKPHYFKLEDIYKFPVIESRKDLYDFLKDESIASEDKVQTIRYLRDKKVIEINLPPHSRRY